MHAIFIPHLFISVTTERFSGHQTDFSELEKALSDPKSSLPPSQSKPMWPDYHPMARLAVVAGHSSLGEDQSRGCPIYCPLLDAGSYAMQSSLKPDTSLPRDLPVSRRDRTGKLIKTRSQPVLRIFFEGSEASTEERVRRLGKDEKLTKEAGIKFNVKVFKS